MPSLLPLSLRAHQVCAHIPLVPAPTPPPQYISGAILFEETLYQTCSNGKKMSEVLTEQGIVPGIKVDKGLAPLSNSNDEQWCMGLDGLDKRCAEYYKAGARFAKWRSVVSIPNGPSTIAVRECAYGLARYAATAQVCVWPCACLGVCS